MTSPGAGPGRATAGPASPREAVGVAIVAATAVLVASAVLAAGLGGAALWAFEVLAAVGLLVGLGAAFGAFERARSLPRWWTARHEGRPAVSAAHADAVEARLGDLDPVEHRRLDLGAPWPVLVVGPTGVSVVTVGDRARGADLRRVREVVAVARRLVAAQPGARAMAVTALLVVPDDDASAPAVDDVRTVAVSDLSDVLARGPLVSMPTVTTLFSRLSARLAPGLWSDAV